MVRWLCTLGWYDNIVIVFVGIELVERRVLCEREVLSTRAFWIVRSSARCEDQPCSWEKEETSCIILLNSEI